ncbi:CPBP family intramembrane metalloprotease [Staphylococcus ursi]|uniref:CPBP family intramembrane glutamic endopeptidase n=1 Tax=Staphylococcus sp. MI 10-1553 TaxID=1912064 RepID=UPI001398C26E|nr:CPBP family intramembrane glutamic endopeptidase [Staphylococcus sp. MI 10-1553]QHW35910.1 CPBP family intramembrane metalloprotease [Staphylococcus sp. MI 10-1553]
MVKVAHKYIRGGMIARVIRIIIINLPFLSIFMFTNLPSIELKVSLDFLTLSIIAAIIMIIFEIPKIYYSNKKIMLKLSYDVKLKNLFSRFSEVTLVPITEELFYRGVLSFSLLNVKAQLLMIVSVILFNIAHFVGRGVKNPIYYLKLTLFSIIAIFIYLKTKNIIYPVIFHILYNIPYFITEMRIYLYKRRFQNE